MIVESGLFNVKNIIIENIPMNEHGMPDIIMEDLSRTVITYNGQHTGLSFRTGMLLSGVDGWHLEILLPLDAPTGEYEYHTELFSATTNEMIFSESGNFVVDNSERVDRGFPLFRSDMFADADTVQKRRSICAECPFKMDAICGQCGCQIESKILNKHEQCPEEKW